MCLTLGVYYIIYYYILYIILYIIYYILFLSYTILSSSSVPSISSSSSLPFPSSVLLLIYLLPSVPPLPILSPFLSFSSSPPNLSLLSFSSPSQSSNPPIHSIRVGSSISLFIFFPIRCFDPACFIGVDG